MTQVGVRLLKNQLSRFLKRVQAGEAIEVTERGRSVARLVPVAASSLREQLDPLQQRGLVHWAGGKPVGGRRARLIGKGKTLAEMVVEDRR